MTDNLESFDKLKIIGSTNTQTRRLGYLVQMCNLLGDQYLSFSELQDRIEDWAEKNNTFLKNHISNKGILRSSIQALASKRYIELAQALQLVTEISGYLRLTKTGRVLLALDKETSTDENDPFKLKNKILLLLIYQILSLDSDYFIPILELTVTYHTQKQILENAQPHLLEHFRTLETQTSSMLLLSEAQGRIEQIQHWTKPVKYLEHLIMPRLHWLLDLELLDWTSFQKSNEFIPSVTGSFLINLAPTVNNQRIITQSWCQNSLFSVWAESLALQTTPWNQVAESHQKFIIQEYIRIGFDKFRTMQYQRISAYQLILFSLLSLLFDKNILVGFEDLKIALSKFASVGEPRWEFSWFAIDDDGYIILPR